MTILTEIDLSFGKTTTHGGSGLQVGPSYVVLYDGEWYRGRFSQQWYGLNFEGGPYPTGCQYDPPYENYSHWQKIYRIEPSAKTARRSADSLLIMAGLDPDKIRADEELPMALRLRKHAINFRMMCNGRIITEDAPIEAFFYDATVPAMESLEEDEDY